MIAIKNAAFSNDRTEKLWRPYQQLR